MKVVRHLCAALCLLFLFAFQAQAHFGAVIPSTNIVTAENKSVDLTLAFLHPFEQSGMDLVKPKAFFVLHEGKKNDLLPSLKETSVLGKMAWQTNQKIARPGVYQFVMEPTPYWEPAEDVFIIHYTKTIVAAFGGDEGWDTPTEIETEIIPLTRPFGNYAGNSFSGQVFFKGKPAVERDVEIELYNKDALTAPSDYHITQVVKTDANGVFTFTCPLPGWWGFSALSEADYTLKDPEGKDKGVEVGAVLWLYLDPQPVKGK